MRVIGPPTVGLPLPLTPSHQGREDYGESRRAYQMISPVSWNLVAR